MAGEGDSISPELRFLEEFRKVGEVTESEEDGIQYRTTGCYVNESDFDGEVTDWALQYLYSHKCPYALAAAVARLTCEELKQTDLNNCIFQENGDTHSESTLDSKKLQQAVHRKVHEICEQWREKPILTPQKRPSYLVSDCAVRNGRRKMEDRHTIIPDLNLFFGLENKSAQGFFGVFDGHAGAEAATYASAHLHHHIIRHPSYETDIHLAIKEGFKKTDELFIERSKRENLKCGTTAVCAIIQESKLYIAWLGDSQAFLLRQGVVAEIGKPHKPSRDDEKERIEKLGGCVVFYGMWRVNGTLAISRAIGDIEYKPYVCSDPDVVTLPRNGSEDFLVMACDGLWDVTTPEDAARTVYTSITTAPDDIPGVAEKLIQKAVSRKSLDNISVIVVFLRDPQDIAKDGVPECLSTSNEMPIPSLSKLPEGTVTNGESPTKISNLWLSEVTAMHSGHENNGVAENSVLQQHSSDNPFLSMENKMTTEVMTRKEGITEYFLAQSEEQSKFHFESETVVTTSSTGAVSLLSFDSKPNATTPSADEIYSSPAMGEKIPISFGESLFQATDVPSNIAEFASQKLNLNELVNLKNPGSDDGMPSPQSDASKTLECFTSSFESTEYTTTTTTTTAASKDIDINFVASKSSLSPCAPEFIPQSYIVPDSPYQSGTNPFDSFCPPKVLADVLPITASITTKEENVSANDFKVEESKETKVETPEALVNLLGDFDAMSPEAEISAKVPTQKAVMPDDVVTEAEIPAISSPEVESPAVVLPVAEIADVPIIEAEISAVASSPVDEIPAVISSPAAEIADVQRQETEIPAQDKTPDDLVFQTEIMTEERKEVELKLKSEAKVDEFSPLEAKLLGEDFQLRLESYRYRSDSAEEDLVNLEVRTPGDGIELDLASHKSAPHRPETMPVEPIVVEAIPETAPVAEDVVDDESEEGEEWRYFKGEPTAVKNEDNVAVEQPGLTSPDNPAGNAPTVPVSPLYSFDGVTGIEVKTEVMTVASSVEQSFSSTIDVIPAFDKRNEQILTSSPVQPSVQSPLMNFDLLAEFDTKAKAKQLESPVEEKANVSTRRESNVSTEPFETSDSDVRLPEMSGESVLNEFVTQRGESRNSDKFLELSFDSIAVSTNLSMQNNCSEILGDQSMDGEPTGKPVLVESEATEPTVKPVELPIVTNKTKKPIKEETKPVGKVEGASGDKSPSKTKAAVGTSKPKTATTKPPAKTTSKTNAAATTTTTTLKVAEKKTPRSATAPAAKPTTALNSSTSAANGVKAQTTAKTTLTRTTAPPKPRLSDVKKTDVKMTKSTTTTTTAATKTLAVSSPSATATKTPAVSSPSATLIKKSAATTTTTTKTSLPPTRTGTVKEAKKPTGSSTLTAKSTTTRTVTAAPTKDSKETVNKQISSTVKMMSTSEAGVTATATKSRTSTASRTVANESMSARSTTNTRTATATRVTRTASVTKETTKKVGVTSSTVSSTTTTTTTAAKAGTARKPATAGAETAKRTTTARRPATAPAKPKVGGPAKTGAAKTATIPTSPVTNNSINSNRHEEEAKEKGILDAKGKEQMAAVGASSPPPPNIGFGDGATNCPVQELDSPCDGTAAPSGSGDPPSLV